MKKITQKVRILLLILFVAGSTLNLIANNITTSFSSYKTGDKASVALFKKVELNSTFDTSFSERLQNKLESYSLKKDFSDRILKIELAVVENIVNRTARLESNYAFNLFLKPSITLGEISAICKGTTTAILPYSATSNSPNKYSIVFSTNDKNLGFKDISAKSHPFTSGAGSISIVVPSNVPYGTYTATFFVSNAAKGDDRTITIRIEDSQKPTISAPAAASGTTNVACTSTNVNLGSPAVADNCTAKANLTVTNNAPSAFPIGNTTVTWTVKDEANNTATATQIVTVTDNINPTITAPANASGTTNVACTSTNVNLGSPVIADNCTAKANLTVTNNAPSAFPIGNTTVTWTVKDAANNITTATQIVTVTDNINPTITAPAAASGTTNVACTSTNVNLGSPAVADNCTAKANLTVTNNAPSAFPIGNTTVIWTVKDAANNTATATQLVTVTDNINPTITAPADKTVSADNNKCTASGLNLGIPTTADNCGIKSVTNNAPATFPLGETTITWTVTDNSDNTQTATHKVIVEDKQAPSTPTLSNIENWSCGKEITNFPTTIDNCAGEITGTTTDPLVYEGFGEYTITWTFTDNANNSTTANQTIIIPEPTVDIPSINGNEYCNESTVPGVNFTGNTLSNKRYDWSYKANNSSSIDIGLPNSGTGNIPEFTAKNNGSEIINVEFTVTPFGNSCKGIPITFTFSIKPTPTMTRPDDIVVCSGEQINQISFPDRIFSVSNSSISWTNNNTSIGLAAVGNGNIKAFKASNDSNENVIATITTTPSANNCEGIAQSFTITVKPKPAISTTLENKTYCNGNSTDIIPLQSGVTGTTYNITGGSAIGLANRTNIKEIPSFSAKAGNATIIITPVANGCLGIPATYTVLVNPTPSLSANPATQAICSGGVTAINLSGSGQSYSWTLAEVGSNITGAVEGSGTSIAQTLTNSGTQPQVVKYKITPEANGCTGTPITVAVTVNPLPDFVIDIPECQSTVDLTDPSIKTTTLSGLTYTYWQNAQATTQLQNPSDVGLGTYYIKGTTSSGCFIINEVIVDNIKPVLTSSITPPDICSNTVFNYSPESNIDGTTYSWTRAAVNGISNPEASSTEENKNNPNEILNNTTTNSIEVTYVYTLKSQGECINTQTVKVNVKPTPMLQDQDYGSELCSGDLFEYIPQSTLGGTNFTWERRSANGSVQSSGNGSISERLNNDTENNIVFTYYYTLSNSLCSNPEEFSVSVTVLPTFQVEASASRIEICPGESIDLFSSTELVQDIEETLLSEDFNSGINWSPNNAGSATWSRQNNYNPPEGGGTINSGSGSFAVANKLNLNPNSNIRESNLITPAFSTQGYTSLTLDFRHFYRDVSENWGDFAVIDYSINNGASWNVYTFFNNTQGSPNAFASFNNPISEIIGHDQVRIRFRFLNQGNDSRAYSWAIDDVTITGEIQSTPEVEWTSSTDENWTSNEQNPTNVTPSGTTVYTVKYTDPDLECPGRASIEVVVRQPPQPKIIADYCAFPEDPNKIRLYVEGYFDTYEWNSSGEQINGGREIIVTKAQGYTVRVTKDGCEGSASIDISRNLIINGDFEQGNTGFITQYGYRTNNPSVRNELVPEGLYTVDKRSNPYHSAFNDNGDHTTGDGNFMIINGDPNLGQTVWETNGFLDVLPNKNYYFGAWTTNLVYRNEANKYARLRLQILVPGNNTPVAESNLGDLTFQPVGKWVEFFNPQLWNSGDNTKVKIRIINENTVRDGNDFGIDDISFAEISSVSFDFAPTYDPICEDSNLNLYANLEGGRDPITFKWTGPNGYTSTEENPVIPNATTANNGLYSLVITDFYGCNNESKSIEVNIQKVDAGEDQVVCSNGTGVQLTGAISGSNAGGTWSTNGSGSFSSNTDLEAIYTPSMQDLTLSSITLTLTSNDTDATCSDEVSISFNIAPVAEVSITPVTCFGANDGSATVNIEQNTGTAPFTYEWKNGDTSINQTTQTATGLAPNPDGYSVIVTDSNGCSTTVISGAIEEPSALQIDEITNTNVTCFGGQDGSATIKVSGGFITTDTSLYVLSLLDSEGNEIVIENSNESGSLLIENLKAGVYTFTANTINGCSLLTENVVIDQPLEIIVDAGEDINPLECGITRVTLSAILVDPTLGEGRWEVLAPSGATNVSFENNLQNNTVFNGESGITYELAWIVKPSIAACPEIIDTINVILPEACSKLNFDGVDDYVDAGNNFAMGPDDFTIEAWIKPNAISGVNTVISRRTDGESNKGYDLFLNNGAPTFRVRDRSVSSTKVVKTDRWYHIAGVYTSSKISLYVDGIEVQNNTNNIPNGSGNFDALFLIGATHAPLETKLTKQHFNGFIEEVRVWRKPLSIEHIRFFMNQRLIKVGTKVDGEILDQDLNLPNAPTLTDFNDLKGYYPLIARGGSIDSGKTPNNGADGNIADGVLKNIQLMQDNTAPLPYILNSENSNWFTKATWKLPLDFNGISKDFQLVDVWDAPNSIGINGEKINWNIVQLNGKSVKNPAGNDIQLLALLDEGGSLNMEGSNENSGSGLTITHYLDLDGKIDLNGESQLVQTQGSILEKTSAGYIERDQQGTANSFNYNYWSSPVSLQNAGTNSGYTISSVMLNGTDLSKPIPMTFVDGAYAADDAAVNITTYWLYKFRGTASIYSEWKYVGKNGALLAGEGFTMKGTSGNAAIKDRQNYTFKGKPNNGDISLNIGKNQNYLLGNPYPSALNADQFIKDNLKTSSGGNNTSGNIFNGALYFWDHFAGKTHNLAEYIGGYATYNLSGGVPAVATDERINNTGESSEVYFGNNAKIPQKYIPVAQGFFVNTVLDPKISGNITVDGGDVLFNNGQRAFAKETKSDSQFLSQEKPKTKGQEKQTDVRPKIRLVYESPKGFNRQILVTADENTTNGFDLGYDAMLNDNNAEDMYWVINQNAFVIQGVPNFNKDQVLPLGVKLKEKGELTIKINELENIKNDIEIFIRDAADSTYHDLRASHFVATLEGGTYDSKYAIVFQKPEPIDPDTGEETDPEEEDPDDGGDTDEDTDGGTDGTPIEKPEDLDALAEIDVVYSMDDKMLRVLNPSEIMVETVELYNMVGQRLMMYTSMSEEDSIDVPLKDYPKATYVVKVRSAIGTASKTILFER
ncbi:SprB repeat-containing protein [Gillisia sp. Hel1_33_143]|uniref:LamG-like jellyroll fold domain-containing protein n=1 Tax=Gillisia sp. Hel1_33_143 TaxID=1336796 RepID=UPI000879E96D|nr:LamG-like jellyroll fold domain-containing protein [Gillisia sp. Hel1_33_143]SDR67256.1 SprB repeat-containing protein [Gillisia sp. Hel1_33_143]